ncbi:MAG TPA: FAD-dependent oxidoreductase, partial [Chitinophagales bacterium]|nr:FAD-dependent oxidoreductase [Chitinophagales bacterium]
MHRKNFLRNIAYSVPAVFLGPSFIKHLLPKISESGSVIIVGAGMAGLYAAKVLQDAGITVTILEASAVHGGRVRTSHDFADFPIELGAEYVQGKGNTGGPTPSFLWSSIDAYNPDLLRDTDGYKEFIALSASDYALSPPYWDANLEFVWNFYETYDDYAGDDILMSDYLFNTYGIDETHPSWYLFENWIGAEFGTTVKRIGLKSLAIQESLWLVGNKNYMLDQSYLDIVTTVFFTGVLPSIVYNKQVNQIDYAGSGVSVTCEDGSTFTADKILVTVPLSILQNNEIDFVPELPAYKTTAINTIGMGGGMKILLKFSEKFWDDDVLWFTLYNYAQSAWTPGLVKTYGTEQVMTLYIMGEKAEYLSGLGEAAIDIVIAELDDLFAGMASEKLVDHLIADWIKEPFIKGVYSYPVVGTFESEAVSKRLDLAMPIDCKLF